MSTLTPHGWWQLGLGLALAGAAAAACGPVYDDGRATQPANELTAEGTGAPTRDSSERSSVQPEALTTLEASRGEVRTCTTAPAVGLDPVAPPLGAADPSGTLNPAPFGLSEYAFYPLAGPAPAPRTRPVAGDLRVELAAPERTAAGRPVQFEYRVTNMTGGLLYMLRPLDGSIEHVREPHLGLYLRADATGAVYRWGHRGQRIDHPNRATPADVAQLEPQRVYTDALGEWAPRDVIVPAAGTYTAWLVYRYCGASVFDDFGPQLDLARVARGEFRSQPVQVRIE